MKYNVCVITSTRADYYLLKLTLIKLNNEPNINLQIIITGSHLIKEFGHTVDEIIKDFSLKTRNFGK